MDEQFWLLLRKGVYPYEYMDDWGKFEENHLSQLKHSTANLIHWELVSDYDHAQRVWREFGIKNLGDYHDLCLKTDVLLLCNVFDTFRTTCLEQYALDPANFFTFPGLVWQACFKKTEVCLEFITDPDMLLMFEQGIQGGITQAVYRYVQANNQGACLAPYVDFNTQTRTRAKNDFEKDFFKLMNNSVF